MEALILTLGAQKVRIKSAMNLNKNKTLEATDLVDFKSYKEGAKFAAKHGNGEFLNHVNFIDLLLELKIPEAEFEALFKIPQFRDITRTELFARIVDFNGKKAFEAGGDTYSTFQIAREFRELSSQGFERAYGTNPHFEEMLNLLDTCPLKTLQAVKELAEPPKSLFAGPLPYAVQQYIFGKCDNHGRTLFQIDKILDRHLEDPNQIKDEETSIERDLGRIGHFVSLLNVIKGGRKIENVYYEGDYLLHCRDLTDGVEKAKLKLGRVKLLHRHQMSDEQMHTKIELLLEERNLTQPIDQKFVDYAGTFKFESGKPLPVKNFEYFLDDKRMYDTAKVCIQNSQKPKGVTKEVCEQLKRDIENGAIQIPAGQDKKDVSESLLCYARRKSNPKLYALSFQQMLEYSVRLLEQPSQKFLALQIK